METTHEFFQQGHYRINWIFMCIVGRWPYQSRWIKYTTIVAAILLLVVQFLGKLMTAVYSWDNKNVVLECIPVVSTDIGGGIMMFNAIVNEAKIQKLLERVHKNWRTPASAKDMEIFHEFGRRGRSLTVKYAVIFLSAGAGFTTTPLMPNIINTLLSRNVTTKAVLPYKMEYFIKKEEHYFPLLVHTYAAIALRLITCVACNTAYFIFGHHACGLCEVICYRLKHITDIDKENADLVPRKSDDVAYSNIIYCIEKHKEVISFVEDIDSAYNVAFFMQLVVSVTGISTAVYQGMQKGVTTSIMVRYAFNLTAQILYLFMQSWQAQQLIDYSSKIHTYVFAGQWYNSSLKAQKLLCILMMKSATPCKIVVGHIILLSFESFSAVMRTAISYFTVINSMQ